MNPVKFADLGLVPPLLTSIEGAGYAVPTPIQSRAIPLVLAGHDLLACAQTGTGKTAAFTLPILQHLLGRPRSGKAPRALVLVPTRELAMQVAASADTYAAGLPLSALAVFGGVGIRPQTEALARGVDIVVATPGRLIDHLQQKNLSLQSIEILVLDEADRMLDMGFIGDIRKIIAAAPQKKQSLLFSATFSNEIRALAKTLLNAPQSVDVAPRNTAAATVRQQLIRVEKALKRDLLVQLFVTHGWHQVLVFARTRYGAEALARRLVKSGIGAAALHGDKSQGARTRALAEFKSGKLAALVATDIAARGLDIEALPRVINFDLPGFAEDYVHRIGRTGRAGMDGVALSLVSEDDQAALAAIEKLIGQRLEAIPTPDLPAPPAKAAPAPQRREVASQASQKAPPARPRSAAPAEKRGKKPARRRGAAGAKRQGSAG